MQATYAQKEQGYLARIRELESAATARGAKLSAASPVDLNPSSQPTDLHKTHSFTGAAATGAVCSQRQSKVVVNQLSRSARTATNGSTGNAAMLAEPTSP